MHSYLDGQYICGCLTSPHKFFLLTLTQMATVIIIIMTIQMIAVIITMMSSLLSLSLPHRIAVINLLHEARGLDTFPMTLQKFQSSGDKESVAILRRNYEEEVYHVQTGVKWFRYIYHREHCRKGNVPSTNGVGLALESGTEGGGNVGDLIESHEGKGPEGLSMLARCDHCATHCKVAFQNIVRKYYSGAIKGPFNVEARSRAGLCEDWYLPLTIA